MTKNVNDIDMPNNPYHYLTLKIFIRKKVRIKSPSFPLCNNIKFPLILLNNASQHPYLNNNCTVEILPHVAGQLPCHFTKITHPVFLFNVRKPHELKKMN